MKRRGASLALFGGFLIWSLGDKQGHIFGHQIRSACRPQNLYREETKPNEFMVTHCRGNDTTR